MEMIKIKHDNKYICNKCGGKNDVAIGDMIEGHITECLTKCKQCGFEDYWTYGFFESSADS